MRDRQQWVDDVAYALNRAGGVNCLAAIYEETRRVRQRRKRRPVRTLQACVRGTLQTRTDMFVALNKGSGIWGLRQAVADALV